eukprot:1163652-Ditylum_brightwellii.AAC.1
MSPSSSVGRNDMVGFVWMPPSSFVGRDDFVWMPPSSFVERDGRRCFDAPSSCVGRDSRLCLDAFFFLGWERC